MHFFALERAINSFIPKMKRILILLPLALAPVAARAATPWALPAWKYRMPVQVYNAGGNPRETVESAKLGKQDFTITDGVLSFAVPLPNADVILVRK